MNAELLPSVTGISVLPTFSTAVNSMDSNVTPLLLPMTTLSWAAIWMIFGAPNLMSNRWSCQRSSTWVSNAQSLQKLRKFLPSKSSVRSM